MNKLPKELFVALETDRSESWLHAKANYKELAGENVGDKKKIGFYKLVKVLELETTAKVTQSK